MSRCPRSTAASSSRAVSFKAPLGRDPRDRGRSRRLPAGRRPRRLRRRPRAQLGCGCARSRRPSGASPSSSPTIRTATAASATASGSTRRHRRSTMLRALRGAGYRVEDMPGRRRRADARGCSPARPMRGPQRAGRGDLSVRRLLGLLRDACRMPVQQARHRRAGARPSATRSSAPGRLDCGRFAIPGFRLGNVAVLIQPARGYNIDPKATYHDPALVPPHAYLAFYAWLADGFRADAVDRISASTALSNGCRARRWRCRRNAFPRRCSGRCRISIRSSSTIPARAPRPSAAPRPSSSTI